jgi:hypothetical protein
MSPRDDPGRENSLAAAVDTGSYPGIRAGWLTRTTRHTPLSA